MQAIMTMKKKHDIDKQPKWVQSLVSDLEFQVFDLKNRLKAAETANDISQNMDWFTLGFNMKEARSLFVLHKDAATKVASIGDGDVLLVGRKKERHPHVFYEHNGFKKGDLVYSNKARGEPKCVFEIKCFSKWKEGEEIKVSLKNNQHKWTVDCLEHYDPNQDNDCLDVLF